MKKKVLILLVAVFSLFILACGGSKDTKSERLENFAFEESIAQKNIKKYNDYIKLNNFIKEENPVAIFDNEYLDEIFNEIDFRDLEGKNLQDFGLKGKESFEKFEEILNEVKKSISESPIYYFDDKVEKLIEISLKLKENVFTIINYYGKAEYKNDNYAKREDLNREYNLLLEDFFNYSDEFFTYMERLEYDEDLKEIITDLGKNKQLALYSLGRFVISANGFVDLIFYKEKLEFSDKEISKLAEINEKLKKELANMEALTDEQLTGEKLNIEEFKEFWIVNAKEIVGYSTEVVEKLKRKENIEETINTLEETRFNFVDTYSSIVM